MKRDDIAFGSSGFECKRQIILRINLAKTDNAGVLVCLHYPFLSGASLVIWMASVRCPSTTVGVPVPSSAITTVLWHVKREQAASAYANTLYTRSDAPIVSD